MNSVLAAALISSVAFGVLAGWMAAKRGRSFWLWGLFGAFSFVIAMIALAIAGEARSSPDRRKVEEVQSILPANNIELFAEQEKRRKQRARQGF